MPKAQSKLGKKKLFFAKHPYCCFCGGTKPATTLDHVPPKACFPDVRGIFIAYSGFSAAAVADVKTALAQKIVVLVELEEIVMALDRAIDLKGLLIDKIHHAQTHKEPLHKRPVQ